LRVSAKELVPNHLTFCIFQHTALFPREHWPKGFGVNGMLTIEGQKMSKSKGNFVTLRTAVSRFGADVTRLTLVLGGEDMNDPDWREENVRSIDSKLKALHRFVSQIVSLSGEAETKSVDRWLISTVQGRIRAVTEAIGNLKTRTAAEIALFEVWNDVRWYLRRTEDSNPHPKVLEEVASVWVRLLAPFTPYLSEELWSLLGKKGLASTATWPSYDGLRVSVQAEEAEALVRSLIEDTTNVIKATKIAPKRICYYVASDWKRKAYLKALERSLLQKVVMRDIMKDLLEEPKLKNKAKEVSGFVGKTVPEVNATPQDQKQRRIETGMLDEKQIVSEAKGFLGKEFKAEVSVYDEEDPQRYDPRGRASMAKPYRPAIYIE